MENPPSSPQSTLATSAVTHEIRSNVTVLRLTQPSLCSSLHQTVRDGKSIRAWSLVTTAAAPEVSFEDLATVPAALPPPPRETVRGRRGVGVQDDEFRFDYGYAFCLHRQDAFTKRGFPITCDGFICRGKTEVYSRKNPPFIWSRDRSRGGALVCPGKPGGRPHLYCLRCAEAQYEGGYALVNQTDGKPTCWEGLFTKYTVFPDKGVVRQSGPDALRNKGEGVGESEPGFDFWMQHRGVLCWHCSGEGLQAAKRTSGAKRPLILDGAGSSARSSARVKRARGTLVTPAKKAPQEAKVRIIFSSHYES